MSARREDTEEVGWVARADRGSLVGMGLGLGLMLLVHAGWSFRLGFFVVLVSTLAQIVFSHLRREP